MGSRRQFLQAASMACAAQFMPGPLLRAVAAHQGSRNKNVLITLFLRGAMDGLNVVAPYDDPLYYAARPTLALSKPNSGAGAALKLDERFALHPALAPLLPLYASQRLAVVHAVGSPDTTRSHFDAQDFMESGTPGNKSTTDGFLGRALARSTLQTGSSLRAVALSPAMPRILTGDPRALACADLKLLGVRANAQVNASFEHMYEAAVSSALQGTARDAFSASNVIHQRDIIKIAPDHGAVYPQNGLGKSLQQFAQLIKADVGLEIGFTDMGGWDTHVNQGAAEGRLSRGLGDLGAAVAAFAADMGERLNNVLLVAFSEFGRTVRENGTGGTDHGHGNCMFVLGGAVKGGRVHGVWPGLDERHLFEGRDLAVTTDSRTVFAEILAQHLGYTVGADIFPGLNTQLIHKIGLLG